MCGVVRARLTSGQGLSSMSSALARLRSATARASSRACRALYTLSVTISFTTSFAAWLVMFTALYVSRGVTLTIVHNFTNLNQKLHAHPKFNSLTRLSQCVIEWQQHVGIHTFSTQREASRLLGASLLFQPPAHSASAARTHQSLDLKARTIGKVKYVITIPFAVSCVSLLSCQQQCETATWALAVQL